MDNTLFISSKHVKLGLGLMGLVLLMPISGCSSTEVEANDQDKSLVALWSQSHNAKAKEAVKQAAVAKVRHEAQEQAQALAAKQSWSESNDAAYNQLLKSTDIVFDENSGTFVHSTHSKNYRESLIEKYRYRYQEDMFKQTTAPSRP